MSIVSIAKSYIGKCDYTWGGTNLDSGKVDCSGYTQKVYEKAGVSIGRDTNAQWTGDGLNVSKEDLQPGDLVFFHSTYDSNHVDNVSHVGIYTGNGMFVHCSSSADNVVESSLNSSYYQSHYLGAKRYTEYTGEESGELSESVAVDSVDTKTSKINKILQPVMVVIVSGGLVIAGALLFTGMIKEM